VHDSTILKFIVSRLSTSFRHHANRQDNKTALLHILFTTVTRGENCKV